MRVECHNIDGFLQELETEADAGHVWQKIVRVDIDRHPEQEQELTFAIAFHGSVLIDLSGAGESPQELLHFDGIAGRDGYTGRTPTGERADPEAGTKRAAEWRQRINDIAAKHGLTVRPGKFELV